jgi:hypothetical protein
LLAKHPLSFVYASEGSGRSSQPGSTGAVSVSSPLLLSDLLQTGRRWI